MKFFILAFVLISLVAALKNPLPTDVEVDGSSGDWDHFQVPPAFTSGAPFNEVNLGSAGLLPFYFSDKSEWTYCDTFDFTGQGYAEFTNLLQNTLTFAGNATLSGQSQSFKFQCYDTFGALNTPQLVPAVVQNGASFTLTTLFLEATTGHTQIQTLSQLTGTLSWSATVPTSGFTSTPLTTSSTFLEPTFTGQLAYVSFSPAAAYVASGVVFLKGQFGVAASATAAPVFQLPAGAAPSATGSYVVICANDVATTVTITSSGSITYQGGAQEWCSLDGVSFLTSAIPSLSGQSSSGLNVYYSSLFRSRDNAAAGRPALAVSQGWGLQFGETFAYGTGAELATFESTSPVLAGQTVNQFFPVATSQGVQVVKNVVSGSTSAFYLTSTPATVPAGFLRVFAANTPSSNSFALLVETSNPDSLTTVSFTFSTGVQATYNIPQSAWTSATKFAPYQTAASGNLFEFRFTDATQTAAGNSVVVTVSSASFTYNF